MYMNQVDEINAYHNENGTWTIEVHSDKSKFVLLAGKIEFQMLGGIDTTPIVTIIMEGHIEK